jgi:hypothetical protein
VGDMIQELRHDSEGLSNIIEHHNAPDRPSSFWGTWLNADHHRREMSSITTEAQSALEKATKAS